MHARARRDIRAHTHIHTYILHILAPDFTFMWGSLRLAPITLFRRGTSTKKCNCNLIGESLQYNNYLINIYSIVRNYYIIDTLDVGLTATSILYVYILQLEWFYEANSIIVH